MAGSRNVLHTNARMRSWPLHFSVVEVRSEGSKRLNTWANTSWFRSRTLVDSDAVFSMVTGGTSVKEEDEDRRLECAQARCLAGAPTTNSERLVSPSRLPRLSSADLPVSRNSFVTPPQNLKGAIIGLRDTGCSHKDLN